MARLRTISPEDPFAEEFVAGEAEKLAAGDIALLDDAAFSSYRWSIWRLRSPEDLAREPQGGEWEQVAIKHGPIDEEWARGTLGGGTFQFRGYFDSGDGRGRTMKRKPTIALAGPRKNFAVVAPPPPLAASVNGADTLTRTERRMLRTLRAMEQRLGQIDRPAPAAQGSSLEELIKSLVALDTLRNRNVQPPPAPTDKDLLESMMSTFRQGIEIGTSRDPLPPGDESVWLKVAEMALPVIDRFLAVLSARRARPGVRPPPPPSSAAVVEEPTAAAAANQVPPSWVVAAQSFARAITIGTEPAEWAYQLEGILSENDYGLLRFATTDELLARLRELAGPESEILKSDHARDYLEAVLAEIKLPPEAEEVTPEGGA